MARRRGGITFGLKVRGLSGIVTNLRQTDKRFLAAVRKTVKRRGAEMRDLARDLAPVKTGNLKASIRDQYSPDGLVVTVGHDLSYYEQTPETYSYDAGIDGEPVDVRYYGGFVELGTVNAPAQPHLGPAHATVAPQLSRDVGEDMKASIARGKRAGRRRR